MKGEKDTALRTKTLAKGLVEQLAFVLDPALRVGVVRAQLRSLPSSLWPTLFAELSRLASRGAPPAQRCLLAAGEALAELERELQVRAQSVRAREQLRFHRGLGDDANTVEVREGNEADRDARSAELAQISVRRDDWGTGKALTLGAKKSLARCGDRRVLERALLDASPEVVSQALQNPRLVELDVVRMCAHPRAQAPCLARVYESVRWASRPRIRSALARNPATADDIRERLLPLLESRELQELLLDERLSERVHEVARAVLALREDLAVR